MVNQELSQLFYEIADYLAMDRVAFKPQAYEKAAMVLESLEQSVKDIYQKGGEKAIEQIPGIGKSIAEKIIEYLKTGKIQYYQDYKKKYPFKVQELISVEGIGPMMAKELYERLGIKNLKDLEKAAKSGKIRDLSRFGEKSEKNILQAIAFLKKSQGRFLLAEILPKVREIEKSLRSQKDVLSISAAGSIRRRKETIGDIDFLAASNNPEKIMNYFCSFPGVVKVWAKGKTKSSIRLKDGFDVDLCIVPVNSYGAALQYFTGSKEHNIKLRTIAIEKGYKLNEYGLFKGKKMLDSDTEEKIYRALGLVCMPPEIREDRGEIESFGPSTSFRTGPAQDKLPELIELSDIKGDLHCHSNWDGGDNSIEEMAQAAQGKGYQYIGISDHTKFLRIEHGLDEKQLAEQRREVDQINSKFKVQGSRFRVLHGCEANIMNDGSIDVNDDALKKLDYAIAGIHSNMKMPKSEMTERMIKAMKNPYIKIISHPTGRLLKKRDEYQIDIDKIMRAAKETKTALEINASPIRLDLDDLNIKKAKEIGVKMIINTDSHEKSQLGLMEYGIFQARRGWATSKDVINTWPVAKLLKFFQ